MQNARSRCFLMSSKMSDVSMLSWMNTTSGLLAAKCCRIISSLNLGVRPRTPLPLVFMVTRVMSFLLPSSCLKLCSSSLALLNSVLPKLIHTCICLHGLDFSANKNIQKITFWVCLLFFWPVPVAIHLRSFATFRRFSVHFCHLNLDQLYWWPIDLFCPYTGHFQLDQVGPSPKDQLSLLFEFFSQQFTISKYKIIPRYLMF